MHLSHCDALIGRKTDRLTGGLTGGQTDRLTDRQTDRQIERGFPRDIPWASETWGIGGWLQELEKYPV